MQFLCLVHNNKNVNSDRTLVDNTVIDVTTTPKGNFWAYLRDKEPTYGRGADNCSKKTNKIVAGGIALLKVFLSNTFTSFLSNRVALFVFLH